MVPEPLDVRTENGTEAGEIGSEPLDESTDSSRLSVGELT